MPATTVMSLLQRYVRLALYVMYSSTFGLYWVARARGPRAAQKILYSTDKVKARPRGSATRGSHELPAPVLVS